MPGTMNWYEAKELCSEIGASLLLPKTDYQWDKVMQLKAANGFERIWVDLTRNSLEEVEGWKRSPNWRSSYDEESYEMFWTGSQPDYAKENCTEVLPLSALSWNNVECDWRLNNVICQFGKIFFLTFMENYFCIVTR